MRKEEFYFDSRDGRTSIHACRYLPEGEVVGVLQIIHGMAEHVERYEPFAEYMTERGFVVTANDHLGHGLSVSQGSPLGYFCDQDPATVVVRDVHRLKKLTQEAFPGVPYIIMGHSMGSFIMRNYLFTYGTGITASIIMGTGMQPAGLLKVSKAIVAVQKAILGGKHVAKMIDKMAFGTYCEKFTPARTSVDWLTRDEAIVDQYVADPLCGFTFTLNGFETLFELISRLLKSDNLAKVPKKLPILMVSGAMDPVGAYGEGVKLAQKSLLDAGVKDITLKLYENDRHEILNELDKNQVMEDIYSWIMSKALEQMATD